MSCIATALILLHTVGEKLPSGSTSKIVGLLMPVNQLDLAAPQVDVIVAGQPINNVTGPRYAFPENAPWIVLASDSIGRVYEADLRAVLSKRPLVPDIDLRATPAECDFSIS
jgi:hypothetical protein